MIELILIASLLTELNASLQIESQSKSRQTWKGWLDMA